MREFLPMGWRPVIGDEITKPYFHALERFVTEERQRYTVYPPEDDVFNALKLTPYAQVKVLLLGQDPYHEPGQAHGLCFSVPPGVPPPPSLRNILRELEDDRGCPPPDSGCLIPWARQGVLLLNAVLTVRAHRSNSHRGRGWEQFTDAIIRKVSEKDTPVVFVLWGNSAREKVRLIDLTRHTVLQSAHPSPLSAWHGFFGSHPFSAVNAALRAASMPEIEWCLTDQSAAGPGAL